MTSLCRRQLRPPRDLVRPLQRSKLGAVQVLGDFLPLALHPGRRGGLQGRGHRDLGAKPGGPIASRHPAVKGFKAFAAKYMPGLDFNNTAALPGYNNAHMIGQVLERCGNELTRENLLRKATTLKDIVPPMFIDGIGVYNSPTDYRAIHHLQLTRFDGTTLAPLGAPVLLDDAS